MLHRVGSAQQLLSENKPQCVATPGEQQTLRELSASMTTKEEHNEICCNRSICPPEKQTAQTRESNSKKLKITLSTGIKSSLMEALVFMVL